MKFFIGNLVAWGQCQKAVMAVEYGLIGSGIGFALIIGTLYFSESFNIVMETFSDYLNNIGKH